MCSRTLFLESKSFAFYACSEWQQEACLFCYFYVALDQGKEAKLLHVRLTGKLFTASAADYKPE